MTVISQGITRFSRLSKPSNRLELTDCWCLSALAAWLLPCSSVSRWHLLISPVLFRNSVFEVQNAVLNFTCVLENCIDFWSFIYLAEMLCSYLQYAFPFLILIFFCELKSHLLYVGLWGCSQKQIQPVSVNTIFQGLPFLLVLDKQNILAICLLPSKNT